MQNVMGWLRSADNLKVLADLGLPCIYRMWLSFHVGMQYAVPTDSQGKLYTANVVSKAVE